MSVTDVTPTTLDSEARVWYDGGMDTNPQPTPAERADAARSRAVGHRAAAEVARARIGTPGFRRADRVAEVERIALFHEADAVRADAEADQLS